MESVIIRALNRRIVWETKNNGEEIDAGDVIISGVVGGGMNMLFGIVGREAGREVGKTAKKVLVAMYKNAKNSISKKSGRIVGKKVAIEILKNSFSSGTQAVFGKVYSMIGSGMLAEFTQ